jgi:hypothetical protein
MSTLEGTQIIYVFIFSSNNAYAHSFVTALSVVAVSVPRPLSIYYHIDKRVAYDHPPELDLPTARIGACKSLLNLSLGLIIPFLSQP